MTMMVVRRLLLLLLLLVLGRLHRRAVHRGRDVWRRRSSQRRARRADHPVGGATTNADRVRIGGRRTGRRRLPGRLRWGCRDHCVGRGPERAHRWQQPRRRCDRIMLRGRQVASAVGHRHRHAHAHRDTVGRHVQHRRAGGPVRLLRLVQLRLRLIHHRGWLLLRLLLLLLVEGMRRLLL